MKIRTIEITTGLFMLLGFAALTYLAVRLGKVEVFGSKGMYPVTAVFSNVGGLRVGASVVIAGVDAGRVRKIELTPDYNARVVLELPVSIKIQDDSIASVKTRGLIGEKYIEITPAGRMKSSNPAARFGTPSLPWTSRN